MADKEFLLKTKEAEQIYLRKDEYDYIKYQEAVLTASNWNSASKTQTITCNGILADVTKQLIIIIPNSSSFDEYTNNAIICKAQGENSLTFYCANIPTNNINIYIVIQDLKGAQVKNE